MTCPSTTSNSLFSNLLLMPSTQAHPEIRPGFSPSIAYGEVERQQLKDRAWTTSTSNGRDCGPVTPFAWQYVISSCAATSPVAAELSNAVQATAHTASTPSSSASQLSPCNHTTKSPTRYLTSMCVYHIPPPPNTYGFPIFCPGLVKC